MNNFYFIFILTFHLITVHGQNTVGTTYILPGVSSGYTLLAPVNSEQTFLIDNCGREIKSWSSQYQMGMTAYLTEDGSLYRAGRINNTAMAMGGIGGVLEKFDWNGNLTWQFFISGSDSVAHHDFCVLPNGNVLLLIAYKKPITEAFDLGKDNNFTSDSTLFDEAIVEIQPLGSDQATVVWRWHVWDHLIQDRDPNKPNFGVIANNPHRMNINYLGYGVDNGRDWMHANAVDYNPIFNQVVISFRNTNEFWIIDHSTSIQEAASSTGGIYGKGGDILYRWGNPAAYDRGNQSNRQLIGQHKVMWIPEGLPGEGNILVFNNGENITYSSIFEISTPINSAGFYQTPPQQAFDPAQPLWVYNDSLNNLFNSGRLSSAQRLSNGNTLICSGQTGYLTEIDNQKNRVWNYRNPISTTGIFQQGNTPIPGTNTVFHALKYPNNFPAFENVTMNPGNPLELNFNFANCEVADLTQHEPNTSFDLSIQPNPSIGILEITSNKKLVEINVVCLDGTVVRSIETNSTHEIIDLFDLPRGTYLIETVHETNFRKRNLFNKM